MPRYSSRNGVPITVPRVMDGSDVLYDVVWSNTAMRLLRRRLLDPRRPPSLPPPRSASAIRSSTASKSVMTISILTSLSPLRCIAPWSLSRTSRL